MWDLDRNRPVTEQLLIKGHEGLAQDLADQQALESGAVDHKLDWPDTIAAQLQVADMPVFVDRCVVDIVEDMRHAATDRELPDEPRQFWSVHMITITRR